MSEDSMIYATAEKAPTEKSAKPKKIKLNKTKSRPTKTLAELRDEMNEKKAEYDAARLAYAEQSMLTLEKSGLIEFLNDEDAINEIVEMMRSSVQ